MQWLFPGRERRDERPERRHEVGEARPLYDPFDDFDLQDEMYNEEGLEDVFTLDPSRDVSEVSHDGRLAESVSKCCINPLLETFQLFPACK